MPRHETEAASPAAPAVEFRAVTKRFGSLLANDRVSFKIKAGSFHGIIGENGAGKSTAMKLLYGLLRPNAGQLFIRGVARSWSSPAEAIAQGIGMVHQHFMLAGPFSALDNIILGVEPGRWGLLQRNLARAQLERLAGQYGLPIDWESPVEAQPVGLQQRIEILKLLYRQADILILDEPTAVLTPPETKALFQNLRRLRDHGKTVILVTHKLKEVMAYTEQVTVLRAGKVMGEFQTSRTGSRELAACMMGETRTENAQLVRSEPRAAVALELENLTVARGTGRSLGLHQISLSIRSGEIVAIAGVEGNGQSELLKTVLHPRDLGQCLSGRIKILGQDVSAWTTAKIRKLGIGVIPEDRQWGILADFSLSENFLLGSQRGAEFSRAGWLCWKRAQAAATQVLQAYDVRPLDLALSAAQLSGGNQQKLILARECRSQPGLIIAAQPTRGLDLGAVESIHRRILEARERGAGVLLVSSDLEEVLALADRILVLSAGRLVAEFPRGTVSEQELGLRMGGVL